MSTVTNNAEQHDMGASDNDLMLRVQKGDLEAFGIIVSRYRSYVVRSVTLCVGVSDAEDVVQGTFLRAITSAASYQPNTNFRAWLMTIARNKALSLLRRQKRIHFTDTEQQYDTVCQNDDPRPTAEKFMLSAELSQQVAEAIMRLPDKQRVVICLYYFEEMTEEAIARVLKVKREHVHYLKHKAHERLRQLLAGYISDE